MLQTCQRFFRSPTRNKKVRPETGRTVCCVDFDRRPMSTVYFAFLRLRFGTRFFGGFRSLNPRNVLARDTMLAAVRGAIP